MTDDRDDRVTVHLTEGECYPFYEAHEETPLHAGGRYYESEECYCDPGDVRRLSVPRRVWERWARVEREWEALQRELRPLLGRASAGRAPAAELGDD